jgi:hypothetical protein
MTDDPNPPGGEPPSSPGPSWPAPPPPPPGPPPPPPPPGPRAPQAAWPPGGAQPPSPPGASGAEPLAVVALVLGIVALPLSVLFVVGIAAVVVGAVALSRIGRNGRGGKGMAIAGLVLGSVGLALGALVLVLTLVGGAIETEQPITDAETGDCIDLAGQTGESVETYTPTGCHGDHQLEVVGVVTADGDAYPGEDALNTLAEHECKRLFTRYVGIELDASELDLQPLIPTRRAWDLGDHEVTCVALAPGGGTLDESVRGSRR